MEESVELIYGKNSDVMKERRFAGLQALSGTGACRLFAEFQRHFHHDVPIFLPDPTWSKYVSVCDSIFFNLSLLLNYLSEI